jgi:excisionase family DNA binding protein
MMDLINAERLEELIREIVRQELADLHHAEDQAGRLLKVPDAAAMLGMSTRTAYDRIAEGKLGAVRDAGKLRVPIEAVNAYRSGLPAAGGAEGW